MKKNNVIMSGLLCIVSPFAYAAAETSTVLNIPIPTVNIRSTHTFVDTETALRLAALISTCAGATVFAAAFIHDLCASEPATPTSTKDSVGMSGGLLLMVVSMGMILKSTWLVRYFDSPAAQSAKSSNG